MESRNLAGAWLAAFHERFLHRSAWLKPEREMACYGVTETPGSAFAMCRLAIRRSGGTDPVAARGVPQRWIR
jgi:hypothetical protein